MKNLADAVLKYYWFLNFCSDDVLEPDTAVREIENLADMIMNSFSPAESEALQAAAKRSLASWLREPDADGYTPRKLLTDAQRAFLESIAKGNFFGQPIKLRLPDCGPVNSPRTLAILKSLGIDASLVASRNLPIFEDAKELVIADVSQSGREHLLVPRAAIAWSQMKQSAEAKGVPLVIVSAFRSIERQADIVRRQLNQGCSPESIFTSCAPPGHSEHHTGRAIDIGTLGCKPLSQEFADTLAYAWLAENAGEFGFRLSYPENNRYGFCYEPWHWFHNSTA